MIPTFWFLLKNPKKFEIFLLNAEKFWLPIFLIIFLPKYLCISFVDLLIFFLYYGAFKSNFNQIHYFHRVNLSLNFVCVYNFSATCRDTYGLTDDLYVSLGDEKRAVCTSEFSDISPLTGGNVAFSTLEGRPSAKNFDNSLELQVFKSRLNLRT